MTARTKTFDGEKYTYYDETWCSDKANRIVDGLRASGWLVRKHYNYNTRNYEIWKRKEE